MKRFPGIRTLQPSRAILFSFSESAARPHPRPLHRDCRHMVSSAHPSESISRQNNNLNQESSPSTPPPSQSASSGWEKLLLLGGALSAAIFGGVIFLKDYIKSKYGGDGLEAFLKRPRTDPELNISYTFWAMPFMWQDLYENHIRTALEMAKGSNGNVSTLSAAVVHLGFLSKLNDEMATKIACDLDADGLMASVSAVLDALDERYAEKQVYLLENPQGKLTADPVDYPQPLKQFIKSYITLLSRVAQSDKNAAIRIAASDVPIRLLRFLLSSSLPSSTYYGVTRKDALRFISSVSHSHEVQLLLMRYGGMTAAFLPELQGMTEEAFDPSISSSVIAQLAAIARALNDGPFKDQFKSIDCRVFMVQHLADRGEEMIATAERFDNRAHLLATYVPLVATSMVAGIAWGGVRGAVRLKGGVSIVSKALRVGMKAGLGASLLNLVAISEIEHSRSFSTQVTSTQAAGAIALLLGINIVLAGFVAHAAPFSLFSTAIGYTMRPDQELLRQELQKTK